MRVELAVLFVAAAYVYDLYAQRAYTSAFLSWFRRGYPYVRVLVYAAGALLICQLIRRHPSRARDLVLHTRNLVTSMPIDKQSARLFSSVFDFTEHTPTRPGFMHRVNPTSTLPLSSKGSGGGGGDGGGGRRQRRAVSETRKKWVAYIQGYKCYDCGVLLDHTYEVDHHVPLVHGGTNDVVGEDGDVQLRALCRSCHGLKTARDKMMHDGY